MARKTEIRHIVDLIRRDTTTTPPTVNRWQVYPENNVPDEYKQVVFKVCLGDTIKIGSDEFHLKKVL